MKLWRENFAPNRIQSKCDEIDINLVATLSENRKTAICKIVNPVDKDKKVNIELPDGLRLGAVQFQIVAPDSLNQRNTMENPGSITPITGKIKVKGHIITFEMPGYSCGVVKIGIRE